MITPVPYKICSDCGYRHSPDLTCAMALSGLSEFRDKEHVNRITGLISALNSAVENAAQDGIETTFETFPVRRISGADAEHEILSGKIRKVLK